MVRVFISHTKKQTKNQKTNPDLYIIIFKIDKTRFKIGLREVILSPSHPKQNIVLDLVEKGNNFKHYHLLQVLLIFALSNLWLP